MTDNIKIKIFEQTPQGFREYADWINISGQIIVSEKENVVIPDHVDPETNTFRKGRPVTRIIYFEKPKKKTLDTIKKIDKKC